MLTASLRSACQFRVGHRAYGLMAAFCSLNNARSKLSPMGDSDEVISSAELRYEFTGGAVSDYQVKAGPPWIRLIITPQHLEFRGRGLLRLLHLGPWIVPRGQVKEVFAKQRRNLFPPIVWNVEIVTTVRACGGPSGRHNTPNRSCSQWKNAATPWIGLTAIGRGSPSSDRQGVRIIHLQSPRKREHVRYGFLKWTGGAVLSHEDFIPCVQPPA